MENNQKVQFQDSVIKLITQGSTKEAIEKALKYFEKHNHLEYHKAVLLLSNRYQRIYNKTIITGKNHTSKNSKITAQLLDLVNDFVAGKKLVSNIISNKRTHIFWMAIVLLFISILISIIWFNKGDIYETNGNQSPIITGDDNNLEFHSQPKKDTIK